MPVYGSSVEEFEKKVAALKKMTQEQVASEVKRLKEQWSALNAEIEDIWNSQQIKDLKAQISQLEERLKQVETAARSKIRPLELKRNEVRGELGLLQKFACEHPQKELLKCPETARNTYIADCGKHFHCLVCGESTENAGPGWDSDKCVFGYKF